LPAPASGTVKAINFSSGDSVAKGDVLCEIGGKARKLGRWEVEKLRSWEVVRLGS
jgi:pyruvate/2-oxoglutarate dehydrogenase complex dihydrolipoamide acyltransferase (E2) component